MIPLRDENPTIIAPVVTVTLIVLNCLVFFYQVALGPAEARFIASFAAVPAEWFRPGMVVGGRGVPPSLTVLTSMFLHANVMHLGGNMLYLWIFGNNIEDVMGHGRFIVFYVLCGVAAMFAHAVTAPESTVPMIGASGAISGVLGAYLLLFPRARVQVLILLGVFTRIVPVPALYVLGFWIVMQVINGAFSWGGLGGGVAWFAHIGGFAVGLALIKVFQRRPIAPALRW
ncbi:MAG: rhomboid family intramembrane serine protease [Nitrospirota bacterium]